MVSLVLVGLADALPSCLQSWEDLFAYANRLSLRRGGPEVFTTARWVPGQPVPAPPTVVLVPARIAGGPRGTDLTAPGPELSPVLRRWAQGGTLVAAVCAGVFAVAEAGLLDGRRATTHWSLADAFRHRFPRVTLDAGVLVIDEGDRVIGGGMTAYFDVGLALVRRFAGDAVARDCAAVFVLDPDRRFQSPFAPAGLGPAEDDPVLAAAVGWALAQTDLGFGVAQWASAVAVEKRTLERRAAAAWGFGPAEKLRRIRLDRARVWVAAGDLAWDEVSRRCGYRDAPAFRRLFLERFGVTPGEYRRRFGNHPRQQEEAPFTGGSQRREKLPGSHTS
jgi:transcriptional regulator GlxA family with amidase domain